MDRGAWRVTAHGVAKNQTQQLNTATLPKPLISSLAWMIAVACPSAFNFSQAILSRQNKTSASLKTKLHTKIFHCLLFLLS